MLCLNFVGVTFYNLQVQTLVIRSLSNTLVLPWPNKPDNEQVFVDVLVLPRDDFMVLLLSQKHFTSRSSVDHTGYSITIYVFCFESWQGTFAS